MGWDGVLLHVGLEDGMEGSRNLRLGRRRRGGCGWESVAESSEGGERG